MTPTEKAAKLGTEHGRNAASWVTDGDTDDATYRRLFVGIEDFDPEVLDALPHADLSGEWADGMTPKSLAEACGYDWYEDEDFDSEALCDAYETAFEQACQDAIAAECLRHLGMVTFR
jgi:hypothetical protein